MSKFAFALGAGALLGAAVFLGPAQAMPPVDGLDAPAARLSPIEQAQFIWGGRRYCFYFDGWHGPGWYWCGYAFRRGFGWGGPEGWHGWWRGGPRPGMRHGPYPHPHPHMRPHGPPPSGHGGPPPGGPPPGGPPPGHS